MNNTRKSKHQLIQELTAAQRKIDVETALERVRGKALAMKGSDDLESVSGTLFGELNALGLPVGLSSIGINDEETETVQFATTLDTVGEWKRFTVSMETLCTDPTMADVLNVQARGGSHHVARLEGEGCRDYHTFWIDCMAESDPDVRVLDRFVEHMEGSTNSFVFFSRGWIYLGLVHSMGEFGDSDFNVVAADLLSDGEIAMVKRFAEVFEFAYDRYLELKQKEQRVREAEIEVAIERVRATALGMQHSNEITTVAKTIYDSYVQLGYEIMHVGIMIIDQTKPNTPILNMWSADAMTPDGAVAESRSYTPNLDDFAPVMKGESFTHPRTTTRAQWQANQEKFWPERGVAKAEIRARAKTIPETIYSNFVSIGNGVISIDTGAAFTDEDFAIGRRFADVFRFAYRRFRELEEKEKQNRELTIQNAIERVRARALGMQESDEISEVASILFEIFSEFEFDLIQTNISIRQGGKGRQWRHWDKRFDMYWPGESNVSYREFDAEDQQKRTDGENRRDAARKRGAPHLVRLIEGDDMKETMTRMNYPVEAIEPLMADLGGRVFMHNIFMNCGNLNLVSQQELSEDQLALARRFAEVFDLAYTRFLELEQKEAQNHQLRLNVVLERIRAEVSGMKEAEDIGRVLGVMHEGIAEIGLEETDIAFTIHNHGRMMEYHLLDKDLGIEPFRKKFYGNLDLYEVPRQEMTEEEFDAYKRSQFANEDIKVRHRNTEEEFETIRDAYKDVATMPSLEIIPRSVMVTEFSHGLIRFHSLQGDQFTTEYEHEIGKAFAEMMSLGWARFLDFRALEAQNQQLEEQNQALEEANEQIQEATRLKSQFLATMSHELRTPMNAIIGFTRLVLRRAANLEDRQRDNLEKVQLSADHLLTLINDILDLSKVEAGRVDLKPTTFQIPPLLQHCCATVGPTLGKRGVELICNIADDVGEAYTDEDRLRQIMINLLSNALKFTDKGEVRVNCKLEGEQPEVGQMLEISVSDTGIGIPEDKLGTIFEEFRQVDGSSTRRHQGTGLGLAITKRLIELMGGSIGVESAEGKGSVFTVKLPVQYEDL